MQRKKQSQDANEAQKQCAGAWAHRRAERIVGRIVGPRAFEESFGAFDPKYTAEDRAEWHRKAGTNRFKLHGHLTPPRPLIAQKRFEVASGTGAQTRYKPLEGEPPLPIYFAHAYDAAKALGLSHGNLTSHLAKDPKRPHVKGYVFEYATEAQITAYKKQQQQQQQQKQKQQKQG